MKLVVAIIRPDKLNEVLEALYRAEVRGLTISRVRGHGGETESVETYRGTTVKMELQEKVRLEIGVSEPFVSVTVNVPPGGATSSTPCLWWCCSPSCSSPTGPRSSARSGTGSWSRSSSPTS